MTLEAFWCDGKQAFKARELAQSIASRKRYGSTSKAPCVYRCVTCAGWHLGHRAKGLPGRKVAIKSGVRA